MTRAFTLIELLVVLAVIAVLAGIAIPVTNIVRRQAKDVECRHHLQQLFTGISGYRLEYQQNFPPALLTLYESGGSLQDDGRATEPQTIKNLWCPRDAKKANEIPKSFGRNPAWNPTPLSLSQPAPGAPRTDLTSYLFELANAPIGTTEQGWGWTEPTWMANKIKQKRTFADTAFPILRCFYHQDWTGRNSNDRTKAVVNLAWDGSIFLSVPEWENP